MKKIIWIILAVCSLAACKKSAVTPSPNITGKWELHRRYGGFIVPPDTTYQAGNGNILQFNSDSTYKSYANGTLSQQGVYHILKGAYKQNNHAYDELYFDDNNYRDATFLYVITVVGPVLTINPLMPDIGTTEYDKIAN